VPHPLCSSKGESLVEMESETRDGGLKSPTLAKTARMGHPAHKFRIKSRATRPVVGRTDCSVAQIAWDVPETEANDQGPTHAKSQTCT
jgi:hypothetical protein